MKGLVFLCCAFLAACSSPPTEDPGRQTYPWVWLLTAEGAENVHGDALQEAMVGHFENMDRLAEEGSLVAAGPLFEPRADPLHRGVYVLSPESMLNAKEIAETDPAAKAGVFEMRVERLHTEDRLDLIATRHEAALEASGVEEPEPGFLCEGYVLITGLPATAARDAMAGSDLPVCFEGTIGEWAMTRQLYCLDFRSLDELPDTLPGGDSVIWSVMPWFSSEQVGLLRDDS